MSDRPGLSFVSTRFLFPADSGGKIRTTQVLRGLKGGAFKVRLLMPTTPALRSRFAEDIDSACDELVTWSEPARTGAAATLRRVARLWHRYPVPVATDYNPAAAGSVSDELARNPDIIVFDFPHSVVLAPRNIETPSVMFTHNVEAEIFERHLKVAGTPLHRLVWKNQYRKMFEFEREALRRFDAVIAVSRRDCDFFEDTFDVQNCRTIPTGVDTDFFRPVAPQGKKRVVFCGSMDWLANIDGIEYFFDKVWPQVRKRVPGATMQVVGRTPPSGLVDKITATAPEWEFTGFVDDVRPYIAGADAFVIPLRVGGGTRIKAFEAMAMGCPVVSTAIGIEGLPVDDGHHYLLADEPEGFASQVAALLTDKQAGRKLSQAGRELVETQYGFRRAARVFEEICLDTLSRGG